MLDPLKSNVLHGEYPGDVDPDEMLDGDGGAWPCCCHGTVPGGERDWGTTFLTKFFTREKYMTLKTCLDTRLLKNLTFGLGFIDRLAYF